MRALLQRVTGASVEADRQVIGSIDRGLVTLLGIAAASVFMYTLFVSMSLARSPAPAPVRITRPRGCPGCR